RQLEGVDAAAIDRIVADELAEARRRAGGGVAPSALYDDFQRDARAAVEEPRRRVTLPDSGRRPTRGGPRDKALAVHEFCSLSGWRCALIEPSLKKTLDSYGDEVRLVWWDNANEPTGILAYLAASGVGSDEAF